MSSIATSELPPEVLQPRELPPVRPSGRFGDLVFANVTRLAAVITLSLLIAIIVSLVIGAWPSIREFGLPFLWTAEWDPVQNKFGGLVMIYGTIATSIIALIIAVPVSFGIALFLTEFRQGGLSVRSELRSNCWRRFRLLSTGCGDCSCLRRSSRSSCSNLCRPR